jgi:sugar-specific transcriptional regulator TrmB
MFAILTKSDISVKLFTMLNNMNKTIEDLTTLGLNRAEAQVYMALLKQPDTHLGLARKTGVNRTKVYRIVDELAKQSLVTEVTDDAGTRLIANDPRTLEVNLISREEKVRHQRDIFCEMLPGLEKLRSGAQRPFDFEVLTYEGEQGIKQMLWHETKTRGEAVMFASSAIEDLVEERRWNEKHRQKTVDSGYTIRELSNRRDHVKPYTFTDVEGFYDIYEQRFISRDQLDIQHAIVTYNDTVSLYCVFGKHRVGVEVNNRLYANMMRQMFENYWAMSESAGKKPH